jgi:hypothetical protein
MRDMHEHVWLPFFPSPRSLCQGSCAVQQTANTKGQALTLHWRLRRWYRTLLAQDALSSGLPSWRQLCCPDLLCMPQTRQVVLHFLPRSIYKGCKYSEIPYEMIF